MHTKPYRRKMHGTEPAINQGTLNGFDLSYNPDDERFYIVRDDETLATFRHWHNATRYCRTHIDAGFMRDFVAATARM